jgi:UDP-N-acetylmuramate--alanine ligase
MEKKILAEAKNIYFIGIGGIGISAIARLLISLGKKVSGSDLSGSEITKGLEKIGVQIYIGQKKENIPSEIDLFIYTVAIKEDNSEFIEAKKRGVKMLTYAQTLNEISKSKYTIAVAGTHGKTTTTAMIAKILIDADLDPTVIVGSLIKDKAGESTNFIAGKSDYFVVEACEYDRSFLNINPKIAIINNIDNDHLDYYGSLDGIISGFREFAQKVPTEGFIVCDPQDERVAKAIRGLSCQIVNRNEFYDSKIVMKVFGEHNRRNAGTALAVASILGLDLIKAKKSLETFAGTWRRFQFKGETKNGVLVYDDYGHHPTEISATLAGARELYPDKRIVVVFQPHLFSRTKLLLNDFATAFSAADEIVLAPIFPAREVFDPTISSEILAEEIKKHNRPGSPTHHPALTKVGKGEGNSAFSSLVKEECHSDDEVVVLSFKNFSDIENYLKSSIKPNDVLITMGAGDQYKIGEALLF